MRQSGTGKQAVARLAHDLIRANLQLHPSKRVTPRWGSRGGHGVGRVINASVGQEPVQQTE